MLGVVAVAGASGSPTPPTVVVTIATVADQLTLDAVSPTVSATVDGAAATITAWAWKCNGATTLLTGETTATPTVTPTGAGPHTLSVDVTIGGVVYPSLVEVFRVGNAAGWVCVWNTNGITDHDHKVTQTKTHNGVDLVRYYDSALPTFGWVGGTLTIETTVGVSCGLTVKVGQVVPATLSGYEIALTFGLGAEITADLDGFFAQYSAISGTGCLVEARRAAGAQKISLEALSGTTARNTAGGLQGRVIGMQLTPGRTGYRPIYSTSAWSGPTGPEPDSMTAGGGTPSGWHSACTLATSASADLFTPEGATQDWVWFAPRSDNGRLYTVPGMAVWVRSLRDLS